MSEKAHWTVEKRIPIAVIIGLVVQTALIFGGGVAAYTKIESRVTINERDIAANSARDGARGVRMRQSETSVTRFETQIDSILDALKRIEGTVDGLYRRGWGGDVPR